MLVVIGTDFDLYKNPVDSKLYWYHRS